MRDSPVIPDPRPARPSGAGLGIGCAAAEFGGPNAPSAAPVRHSPTPADTRATPRHHRPARERAEPADRADSIPVPASPPAPERATHTDPAAVALAPVLRFRPRSAEASGSPLFCVAPSDGLAWPYAGLTAHLPPSVPLYGLQPPGLIPGPVPGGTGEPGPARGTVPADTWHPATVADFAEHGAASLRTVAAHGPYRLLGLGFGGFVAYEIAARLRAAGEQVDLVVVDCVPGRGERPDAPSANASTHAGTVPTATSAEAPVPGPANPLDLARVTGVVRPRTAGVASAARSATATYRPTASDIDLTVVVLAGTRVGADDPAAALRRWRRHTSGRVTGRLLDAAPDELAAPEVSALLAEILDARPRG